MKSIKLKDLLKRKSLKDLLTIMGDSGVPVPEGFEPADWELLVKSAKTEGEIRLEYYQELLDPDTEMWRDPEEEVPEEVLEYEQLCRHKGELLKAAEQRLDQLCSLTAAHLLLHEKISKLFLGMNDLTVSIFRKASLGELERDEEGYYQCDVDAERVHHVTSPEWQGYVDYLRSIPSTERRSRITGALIPDDVLDRFREVDGPQIEERRKTNCILCDCSHTLLAYHEITSEDNLYQLYRSVVLEEGDVRLYSIEDFREAVLQLFAEDEWHAFVERNGRFFLTDRGSMEADPTFEPEGYQSFFDAVASEWDDETDYYIPSPQEVREFCDCGYWPSRKPYRDLMEYLVDFYLDEMTISQMTSSMFRMFADYEDDRAGYTLDTVYENAEEDMAEITFYLRLNQGWEFVWDEMERLHAGVKDEAKERFRNCLKECDEVTNKPFFRGYTYDKELG